jgi:peptide/nickel transport system substrate-binding protein
VRAILWSLFLVVLAAAPVGAQGQPDGQLTVAFDASIASSFLDPAEMPTRHTIRVLYALHDALIGRCPATTWRRAWPSRGRRARTGSCTSSSCARASASTTAIRSRPTTSSSAPSLQGRSAKLLHDRVKAVEVLDPHRVRFVLHTPWPDFLVFYATPATGAAWIVPKKYIEKVGEDGFKRQPIGLGPYVRPLESRGRGGVRANDQYWRKKPSIKRVVIKGARPHNASGDAGRPARPTSDT